MTFAKMNAGQLSAELERYQIQLEHQQNNGSRITPAQRRRFYALRAAYNRAQIQAAI